MKNIIIIGGGASGFAAAITAAKGGAQVTVLEQNTKPGRKILLSGNGRCNLSNTLLPECAYHGSFSDTAYRMLAEEREALDAFFDFSGIKTRIVGTGIYPYSEESASVLANLSRTAEACGVTVRNNTPAVRIEYAPDRGFVVCSDSWRYEADRVILCTGSRASVKEDAADGYRLACGFGHTLTEIVPALVPLVLEGTGFSAWAGVRARGRVTVCGKSQEASSEGQIQFTGYGISGIPVMDVSGFAAQCLADREKAVIRIDLLPECTAEELEKLLEKRLSGTDAVIEENIVYSAEEVNKALCGVLPEKLVHVLVKRNCSIPELVKILKASEWNIRSSKPISEAQCVSGGVPAEEVDPLTFESKLQKGLYLCGELLDLDGICGGYNLSFAFLSGIKAGEAACK